MEQADSLAPLEKNNNNADVVCSPDLMELKREERHLKYWVIKVLVLTIAFLFVATVGTFLYVFVVRGTSVDGGVIGTFLQAVTEIIKFMAAPVS